jgi:outer membrane protein TolC
LLNRNHAAIDVATAKRNAQAQRVYAKQSDIISEVERLRLQSVSLIKPLALAEAAKHEATEQLNLLKAQFEAGQIDTLTLIEGKQQLLLASRFVLEAQSALQRSSWALEQSMQKPLPLAKPNE